MKKISHFQLLTFSKKLHIRRLTGSEYTSFQVTININKPYMANTNHMRTLRQDKYVYLMPGEPLKEDSQRNQMTYMKS